MRQIPSPASKPMLNSNLANLLQQGMEYEKGVLLHRLIEIFASLLQQLLQQDNVDGQTTENVFLPQHQRVAALKWLTKARKNQHMDAQPIIFAYWRTRTSRVH